MVKSAKKKAKKIVKLPARTLVNLRKANCKLDPRVNERIRIKNPPRRSKLSLVKRQVTKKWRERLDDDGQHRPSSFSNFVFSMSTFVLDAKGHFWDAAWVCAKQWEAEGKPIKEIARLLNSDC